MRPALAAITFLIVPTCCYALAADELLLVCNADLPESCELARYYAQTRSVPKDRTLGLHVNPRDEEIAAADFASQVREPLRSFLAQRHLREQIKCLVTFYGLPIRVRDISSTPEQRAVREGIEQQFVAALDALEQITAKMDAIGNAKASAAPVRRPTMQDYASVLRRYGEIRKGTLERLRASSGGDSGGAGVREFVDLLQQAEGVSAYLDQFQARSHDAGDAAHQQLAAAREKAREADRELAQALSAGISDPQRPAVRKLMRDYHGVVGLLRLLDNDIQYLRTDETSAAVDSELTLLWYDEYPRYRWFPNLLSWNNRANAALKSQLSVAYWATPVLMVSRLDASGPKVVQRMIDDAIAAEKHGLRGRVYLDARGIYKEQAVAQYDSNLRDLELLLKKQTPLDVRLDNHAEVFGPGACPDTMLYCGWYSLRKYVPSFKFDRGAVAFHIASFEAMSLHREGEGGWCKNLLDFGAAATLGPVAEPYLHAFPLPSEFFGLLLTGRFTLAECYAYTSNLNSWMMMLLGDPLYRPFAKHPYLRVEQVFPEERIPAEFRSPASAPASDVAK